MALEFAFLLLTFFLPGYFLVNLVFPGKGSLGGELDALYRAFLGIVLSVSITIAYGTLLVILGTLEGSVLFLPRYLWPGLAIATLLLFLGGVYRGAYPRISRWLGRMPAAPAKAPGTDTSIFDELEEVEDRLEEALRRAGEARGEEAARIQETIRQLEDRKRKLEERAGRLW